MTLLKPIPPQHLSSSSTRCPAVGWTTYSPPIHRPRIGSPRSKNYRVKWASAVSQERQTLEIRGRTAPGDDLSPTVDRDRPIPREAVDPQCCATDRSRYC